MQLAALGEDAKVAIFDLGRELCESRLAVLQQPRIAEHHQPRLDVLRQRLVAHRVKHEPSRQVALAHGTAGPVDDFRREHAADAQPTRRF